MRRSRVLTEMLLFFLAFFLPGYLAQASLASTGPASTLTLLQSIVTGLPQFLLMAYVVVFTDAGPARRWGLVPLKPRDGAWVALLLAACFAILAPFAALVLVLPPSWTGALTRGFRWGLQSGFQLPLALLFGLTAGYREEFFFRAYLLGRLGELGVATPLAAALSTALFCLGHGYEGPLGIAISASLGALFCIAYIRRPNLHVIAIAHGLYNTIVLCLSLLLPRALPSAVVARILFFV